MQEITRYDHGIMAVDSGFLRPHFDAIHLIREGDRLALVDTGTNHSVPRVLAALEQEGATPEQVDYVLLTHVHLDHAGGAGQFMQKFPNARLVVHPRGARHMIDPGKLWNATVAVYGQQVAEASYGEIVPIAAERVIDATDGLSVSLNGRQISFHDSPGHARHHVFIRDGRSGHIFTGDTFGVSYRELDQGGRPSIFPSTTPTQFDPLALNASIDRIMNFAPEAVYLTHYSQVRDLDRLSADMHRLVNAHAEIGEAHADQSPGTQRLASLTAAVQALVLSERERQQWTVDEATTLELFKGDIELNAAGIDAWLQSRENA